MNSIDNHHADAIPLLYAPLERYVPPVLGLILSHVWDRKQQEPTASTVALLDDCRWLARLLTCDKRVMSEETEGDVPGWASVKQDLVARIEAADDSDQADAMAEDCVRRLLPTLGERFITDYRMPARPFHCWWYTLHHGDTMAAVHLINADMPD
ncbi:MAG: hypothetical protein ACR2NM_15805, partial [Bythopirellula sp.]